MTSVANFLSLREEHLSRLIKTKVQLSKLAEKAEHQLETADSVLINEITSQLMDKINQEREQINKLGMPVVAAKKKLEDLYSQCMHLNNQKGLSPFNKTLPKKDKLEKKLREEAEVLTDKEVLEIRQQINYLKEIELRNSKRAELDELIVKQKKICSDLQSTIKGRQNEIEKLQSKIKHLKSKQIQNVKTSLQEYFSKEIELIDEQIELLKQGESIPTLQSQQFQSIESEYRDGSSLQLLENKKSQNVTQQVKPNQQKQQDSKVKKGFEKIELNNLTLSGQSNEKSSRMPEWPPRIFVR